MAETKLANVIVPPIYQAYHAENFPKLAAFWAAGVVRDVSEQVSDQRGGSVIDMPFWKPLQASGTVLVDTANISPAAYVAAQASAPIVGRVNAWTRTDLAAVLAGSDPAEALYSHLVKVDVDEKQSSLISGLNGAFVAGAENTLNISALSGNAAKIDASAVLDTEQLLGDAKTKLAAMAMHSAVETALRKQNLIEYVQPSEGGLPIPFYNGKRVIVDDSIGFTGSGANRVFNTYLFAAGSVGYANVPSDDLVALETERQALINGGQETLVQRLRYVLAPNGFRWTPASGVPVAAKAGPSNAELGGDNWTKVYETKNVGITVLRSKV